MPTNAVIVGAFYGFGITGTGGDLTTSAPPPDRSVEVRRVTQPAWTEGGATWNTYDGTNPWSTPGGAIATTVSASFPLTTFFRFLNGRSSPINKFFGSGTITGDIFDVTSDAIAGFAATKSLDLAVKLDNDTTNGAAIGFSGPSSESGSGFSPQLFVIYTVPVAPPPTITAVAASPQLFSPNASLGINDLTSINFTISQNANVTIKILNSANSLVRTLISLSPRIAGANGEVWDGKNDSGVFLPSGTYTFTIDAVGGSGSAVQQSGVVTVDNDGPVIGTSLFSFARFASAIGVTLGPGEQSVQLVPGTADGKDTTINSLASNLNMGNATDLFVQTVPNSGLIVTNRSLTSFDLSNIPANANIAGAFYGFGITGTGGDLSVNGPPPGRSVEIRRITQPAWTEGGATWNTYDGTNPWAVPGGDIASVISSSYPMTTFFGFGGGRWGPINKFFGSAVITGDIFDVTSDAASQFATNKRLDLVVKLDNDRTNGADTGFSLPASESDSNFSPQLFIVYSNYTFAPSLNPGSTVTINYKLSEPVNATIKILNSGGGIVRNLTTLSPRSPGNNSEIWDGRDNSNQLVADGVYTMAVDAVDAAGNSALQVMIKIVVDNTITVRSADTTLTLTSTIPGGGVPKAVEIVVAFG